MTSSTAPKRRRPTVADVAREAGVSIASTGRALGDYGYVSNDVRTAVLDAAKKLGYRPNSVARSMRNGTTRTIGFVCSDIESPFFSSVMRGIADIAHAAGYETLLFNTDERIDAESAAVRVLLEKQVDGIIVVPASVRESSHLEQAITQGTSVVLVDRAIPGLAADTVLSNNEDVAHAAVAHLTALGHRRVAVVASTSTTDRFGGFNMRAGLMRPRGPERPVTQRLNGYFRALTEAGIDHDPELVKYSDAQGELQDAVRSLLDLEDPPTAMFATDDRATKAMFRAVHDRRVRVPRAISIIGFDDLEWMQMVDPPLTAVVQPAYEMGQEAARLLVTRLTDGEAPPATYVLRAELVHRRSVAAPK